MHITKGMMPIRKDYRLCDSNYMTFFQKQNYGKGKTFGGCQVSDGAGGAGRGEQVEHGGPCGQGKHSSHPNDGHVSARLPKLTECTPPRVNITQTMNLG